VLEGIPDHRDSILTEVDRAATTACTSVSREHGSESIVLDL
jgi:hypothetical protein